MKMYFQFRGNRFLWKRKTLDVIRNSKERINLIGNYCQILP